MVSISAGEGVTDMNGMDTFGPIDWRAFYSISARRREAEAKERAEIEARAKEIASLKACTQASPELPCTTCPRSAWKAGCGRRPDPDHPSFCLEFGAWVCVSWRIVTKALRKEKKREKFVL